MTDTPEMPTEERISLTMFDKSEPRSLINIVWTDFKPVLERAPILCEKFLGLSERRLRRKSKASPLDDMLRLRFWQEYERAQMATQNMLLKEVIKSICSFDYWEDTILKSPVKLAYLLTPIAGYLTRMETSLYILMDEIDRIIRMPLMQIQVDKYGKEHKVLDNKLLSEKVKLFQMLDVRVKGATVQKLAIHQRVDTRHQGVLENMSLNDLEGLDAALKKVQTQIKRAQTRELLPVNTIEAAPIEIVEASESE